MVRAVGEKLVLDMIKEKTIMGQVRGSVRGKTCTKSDGKINK